MNQPEQPEQEAAERSTVYAILSRAFLKEPDGALIRYFKSPDVQEAMKELDLSFGEDFLSSDEGMLVEELAIEYARLFLTPPTHLPPYESFYVGGLHDPEEVFEPTLQGKASKEVQDFYRSHQILFADDCIEFPDHIGIELEAMRLLCDVESKTPVSNDPEKILHVRRLQGKFLAEHPNRWIPIFCEQVLQRTMNSFFPVIVQLTKAFIESELETLRPCSLEEEEVVL